MDRISGRRYSRHRRAVVRVNSSTFSPHITPSSRRHYVRVCCRHTSHRKRFFPVSVVSAVTATTATESFLSYRFHVICQTHRILSQTDRSRQSYGCCILYHLSIYNNSINIVFRPLGGACDGDVASSVGIHGQVTCCSGRIGLSSLT